VMVRDLTVSHRWMVGRTGGTSQGRSQRTASPQQRKNAEARAARR
jgi:hypothetical protein